MAHIATGKPGMMKEQTLKFDDMDDEQLDTLRVDVLTEQERRSKVADLPGQLDDAAAAYQEAAGIADGTEYVPPTGAHNAVRAGSTRTFEGVLYRNVSGVPLAHSPAEYPAGWELVGEGVDPVVPDPDDHPAWSPDAVAYIAGNIVTYDGGGYECIQPHTSQTGWTPAAVPALWNKIS